MLNIGQEIMLVEMSTGAMSKSDAERALEVELEAINEELDTYTCKADTQDYAFAIASGILCGLFDAVYVGEASILSSDEIVDARVKNGALHEFLSKGYTSLGETLAKANDAVQKASEIPFVDVPTVSDLVTVQMEALSQQPSVVGIAASIASFMLQSVGRTKLDELAKNAENVEAILVASMIAGFLQWSKKAGVEVCERGVQSNLPQVLDGLLRMMHDQPVFSKIAGVSTKWHRKQMAQIKRASKRGGRVSVVSMLHSFMSEVAALPELQTTALKGYLAACVLQQNASSELDPQTQAALNKQAVPVLLNEVVVRLGYFLSRFGRALQEHGDYSLIDWKDVMPFDNRTVERMITISSMTLTFADTYDAVTHASLESAGNVLLFSQKFVARWNYVAAGRVAVAIVREIQDDQYELELLRNRRRLVEQKTVLTVERLDAYEQWLQGNLDKYLTEHLTTFFEAFDIMDEGLKKGDSNLVIQGNVIIQRELGREVQFTNQEEFDELMFSDEDFVF
ncbi:MAG: hypothetical protein IKF14_02860 [Atopobiaceae bacterium]|nr:hypothetical protein [Atopobiaceae bacterium]